MVAKGIINIDVDKKFSPLTLKSIYTFNRFVT